MCFVSKNQALSLRSQWLGENLRAARARAGYTLRDAGEYVGLDFTSIGRFERGTHVIRPAYVRDLINFYGVSDELERRRLLRLNEDAWRKDWWDGDTSDLDTGFVDYTWLEARAAEIRAFSPLLIHGLIQTVDYAEALTRAGLPDADEATIARLVEVRMTRQRIFLGENPTRIRLVLEELPLRRALGGSEVHQGQLKHLLELPSAIELRILPPSLSWHPGLQGPFTYFDMPDPYPHVAYFEGLIGRTFLEADSKVAHFKRAYDDLYRLALSPTESRQVIETILKGSA